MPSSPNPAKTKILVVDDEAIIADTLALILNQSGFEAMAAYRGHQAVDLASQSPPDVLLIDIVMEDMTGIDAALAIGKEHPDCSIIFISGHGDAPTMMDRYARGLRCRLLPKPLHPEELLAALRSLPARYAA
ncbi:MAG TPA: response regulator [Acidobacteriaceae bacterium]|nr:response regulator [Acidobacteriaceae bacterium]